MESVVIATNARGGISFVTQDLEQTKKHLRKQGFHPLRNQTHSLTWYDHMNEFVCLLTVYDVGVV